MPRPLPEILEDIAQHYEDNPTHGVGCACIDEFRREAKRGIKQHHYRYLSIIGNDLNTARVYDFAE